MIPPDPKRLYRNTEDKMLAGVCAGLSDYLGWDRALVRLAFVVGSFFAGPFFPMAYLVLWLIMPRKPKALFRDHGEKTFWQSVNTRPGGTVGDLARKFRDLDSRLAGMERRVTTPNFDLEREFKNLGA
jgi:phage shock protein C